MVYLAGPISGLSWEEATSWRKAVSLQLQDCGIKCLSPLRAKNYLSHLNDEKIKDNYNDRPDFGLSTSKGITTRDKWDAMRCDVLFVNFLESKKVSIGTVMEIAWADSKNIPIVVVMEKDNPHRHSMITETAGFICENLDDAISITKALLLQ